MSAWDWLPPVLYPATGWKSSPRWRGQPSCTSVVALDLSSVEGQPVPPKTDQSVAAHPLVQVVVGVALTAVLGVLAWLFLQVWTDMGRRVESLEREAPIIRNEVAGLKKDIGEVRGLIQGFIAALPLKQRAAAYGIQDAAIEEVPLSPGKALTIKGRTAAGPYDLRVTVDRIVDNSLRLQVNGTASGNIFRNIGLLVPLTPGTIVRIPLPASGLPPLYLAVLNRGPRSAVVAVGPKRASST